MPSEPTTCAVHFEEKSAASCHSCGRTMCRECWARDVDDDPWCEACVALLERPTPMVLYVVGALLSFAGVFASSLALSRRYEIVVELLWVILPIAALVVGITTYMLHGRAERARTAHAVAARTASPPRAQPQSPYRGRLRRLARVVAPPLSGQMTVLVTVLLMALIAAAVPRVLTLPRWVEWELVMGGWWAIWTGILSVLLFRGWRIADDVPDLWRGGVRKPNLRGGSLLDGVSGTGPEGCIDLEGCAVAILISLALAIAFALAWVIVELVLPVVIAAAYWLIVRALTRVANDHHECEGHLLRSLGWASLWALLYTAPLAVVIAIGQAILAARADGTELFQFARDKTSDSYALERYQNETKRLLGVLDSHFADGRDYIMGDITIADFAIFPWLHGLVSFYEAGPMVGWDELEHVPAYVERCKARPSWERGKDVCAPG